MQFHIVTLFPEMFEGPTTSSILKRALEKGSIEIDFVNPRDFAADKTSIRRRAAIRRRPRDGDDGTAFDESDRSHQR